MKRREPIYVCGATASGKTSFSLNLATEFDGEIINGDAMQLYRGIEILSAAPSLEESSKIPHHLFGIFEPGDDCDAGRYATIAKETIAEIQTRGKTPIIVGGSGLYLKFLTHGASPLPRANPKLRADLEAQPLEQLLAQLEKLDPVEAEIVDRCNTRYVARSLEICLLSGNRVSELRDRWEEKTKQIEAQLQGFWLIRNREELHQRIAIRTKQMLDQGAIEEVAKLQSLSGNWAKAIGVHEIREFLKGEISQDQCQEKIEAATRQYAKRQETWFRRETWLKQTFLSTKDQE